MKIELTQEEAEILIAVLTFSEGVAESPSMVEALKHLRPWRSALLQAYLTLRGQEGA